MTAWLKTTAQSALAGIGRALPVLALLGLGAPSEAQATDAPVLSFSIPFEKYTLDNGLEVILHQDLSQPLVAVNIWYHTGPLNEPPGRSGFAHLFEHLMFEGSLHAGRQFDPLLEAVGGTNMNATTSWDRTNYFETVPGEYLELALWLEADRMGFMIDVLTQQRLDVQREVVKNERRQSYENSPYGPSWLRVYHELFPRGHPYHGAVIGSMRDLDAATLRDVQRFFRVNYAPGNATLALVGHFDRDRAKRLIQKHFGTLAPRGGRAPVTRPPEPPSVHDRVIVPEAVSLEQLIWAWTAPPAFDGSEAPLILCADVLAAGKSSRLYRALVSTGMASDVDADLDANHLASVFTIDARIASGTLLSQVEAVFERELSRLATGGPTGAELARVKKRRLLLYASQLQELNDEGGEGGRAGLLQRFNHYLADPAGLAGHVARLQAVTSDQVAESARRYLTAKRRLVVLTQRRAKEP